MSSGKPTRGTSGIADRIARQSMRPPNMGVSPAGAVSLALGEPNEGTPTAVVEAAVDALRAGRTRYSALAGLPALREAIVAQLETRHGKTWGVDSVVCTHGASAGLAAAVLATIDPGDKVVLPEPTYSLYADHVAMAGGHVVWVANRDDGSIDIEGVEAELAGARMVIVCSPGNPTGTVLSERDLARLSEAAMAAGAYLLCDEAYSHIVFDGVPFFSSLDLASTDHVICCNTFSKAYAMTGWRLGYVVAEPGLAAAINLVHRTFNGALSTFVQDAGVVALETPAADLQALARSYQDRRDMVLAALGDLPGVSITPAQGAFYAFVRVDSGLSSAELLARFAEAGVLVRSGLEFGPSGDGAFRISFAVDQDQLAAGLGIIATVLRAAAPAQA
jgi:aspartate aminotransferase